jgi:hypothetical protein
MSSPMESRDFLVSIFLVFNECLIIEIVYPAISLSVDVKKSFFNFQIPPIKKIPHSVGNSTKMEKSFPKWSRESPNSV